MGRGNHLELVIAADGRFHSKESVCKLFNCGTDSYEADVEFRKWDPWIARQLTKFDAGEPHKERSAVRLKIERLDSMRGGIYL